MTKKSTPPTSKLSGAPFEIEGAQRLNRHKRRAAAGRLSRAGISGDPLTTFLQTRKGLLWLLGTALLFTVLMAGIFVARM